MGKQLTSAGTACLTGNPLMVSSLPITNTCPISMHDWSCRPSSSIFSMPVNSCWARESGEREGGGGRERELRREREREEREGEEERERGREREREREGERGREREGERGREGGRERRREREERERREQSMITIHATHICSSWHTQNLTIYTQTIIIYKTYNNEALCVYVCTI